MNKELDKLILEVLKNEDIHVVSTDDPTCTVLQFYSRAGEDFVFSVCHYNNIESFAEAVRIVFEDFDVDEHAAELIPNRGKDGIPATIAEILEDAEYIKSKLRNLYSEAWHAKEYGDAYLHPMDIPF